MAPIFVRNLQCLTPFLLRPVLLFPGMLKPSNRLYKLSTAVKSRLQKVGFVFGVVAAAQSLTLQDDSQKLEPISKMKLRPVDPERLTFSLLIKQAASHTVDAASSVLTQTAHAILDSENKYRRELKKLIKLMEYHLKLLGNHEEEDTVWDQIIATRSTSEATKKAIAEMELFLQSVTQLMLAAAETAQHADCEYGSVAASERMQSATSELSMSKAKTKELETKYLELYTKIITETGCDRAKN